MGGRGSHGGGGSNGGGGIITGKPRTIETTYFSASSRGGSRYKDTVLEAVADKSGNVTFSYATPKFGAKASKTNKTTPVSYTLRAGAVNGQSFGINWGKVQSISGQTYDLRSEAKANGLSWDGKRKRWQRK